MLVTQAGKKVSIGMPFGPIKTAFFRFGLDM
jgi:hypothetical protein